MIAIFKKELHAYFTSIIGWVFLTLFLTFVGLYVYLYNFLNRSAFIGYPLQGVLLVTSFIVPLLTMRIFAEEKRQKTDQLLLTSPVPIWKIVVGKYLALVSLLAIAMLIICVYPLIFTQFGIVNLKLSYTAIWGFFLLLSAYIAIGLFISSTTESQILAAILTIGVLLIINLADGIAQMLPQTARVAFITYSALLALVALWIALMIKNSIVGIAVYALGECVLTVIYTMKPTLLEGTIPKVFGVISMPSVYSETISGIFELRMPFYYLSIAFVCCFLTYQNIRKRRYS